MGGAGEFMVKKGCASEHARESTYLIFTYLRFVVVEEPCGPAPSHDLDSVVGRDRVVADENFVAGVVVMACA